MDGILEDLSTPRWWFTAVFVGIIIGIILELIKWAYRKFGGRFSKTLKARNEKKAAQDADTVTDLVDNPDEITDFKLEGLYKGIVYIVVFMIGLTFIIISQPSDNTLSFISAVYLVSGMSLLFYSFFVILPNVFRHRILSNRARNVLRKSKEQESDISF